MLCRKKEPLLWAEILFGSFVCVFFSAIRT